MYFNVFRSRKREELDAEAYAADAARMEALARSQKGFIAFRRYASADGEGLSISEWETEEDARAWARHPEWRCRHGDARTITTATSSIRAWNLA